MAARVAVPLFVSLLACLALAASARSAAPPPLGTISIPRLGIYNHPWYQHTTQSVLAYGPGHYDFTEMPGCGNCTVGIAGHRVTPVPGYGNHGPFRYADKLRRGDVIRLTVNGRKHKVFIYRVDKLSVVRPTDDLVSTQPGYERLVLSSCTPPHFATYRLIVQAHLANARLLR